MRVRDDATNLLEASLPRDLIELITEFCESTSLARLLHAGNKHLHLIASDTLLRRACKGIDARPLSRPSSAVRLKEPLQPSESPDCCSDLLDVRFSRYRYRLDTAESRSICCALYCKISATVDVYRACGPRALPDLRLADLTPTIGRLHLHILPETSLDPSTYSFISGLEYLRVLHIDLQAWYEHKRASLQFGHMMDFWALERHVFAAAENLLRCTLSTCELPKLRKISLHMGQDGWMAKEAVAKVQVEAGRRSQGPVEVVNASSR